MHTTFLIDKSQDDITNFSSQGQGISGSDTQVWPVLPTPSRKQCRSRSRHPPARRSPRQLDQLPPFEEFDRQGRRQRHDIWTRCHHPPGQDRGGHRLRRLHSEGGAWDAKRGPQSYIWHRKRPHMDAVSALWRPLLQAKRGHLWSLQVHLLRHRLLYIHRVLSTQIFHR